MLDYIERLRRHATDDPAWFCFLGFAGAAMLSLPLARLFLLLSLFFTIRARTRLRMTLPAWGWVVYLVLAVVVTAAVAIANTPWGVEHGLTDAVDIYIEPARGLRKTTKLLWYVSIPLSATLVNTRVRLRSALIAIMACGTALALWMIVVNPLIAFLQLHWHPSCACIDQFLSNDIWVRSARRPPSFHVALAALGTMHDAQRLMVALVCGACLTASVRRDGCPTRWHSLSLAIISIALVVSCKRGPMTLGVVIAFAVLAAEFRLRRVLPLVAILVCVAMAMPATRARFADIPGEFRAKRGGRALMWTTVVPNLHREYPRGLGFRSLTDIKMHNAHWRVEKGRNHVHSTPLQAFVDFSWAGVAVWLAWMGMAFFCAMRAARACPPLSAAPLCALAAIVAFSLVEYNLADAAVVPLYGLAMGIASSSVAERKADSPPAPVRC